MNPAPVTRQQQSLRDIHQAIVDLTAVVSKAVSGSDSGLLVEQVEAMEAQLKDHSDANAVLEALVEKQSEANAYLAKQLTAANELVSQLGAGQ